MTGIGLTKIVAPTITTGWDLAVALQDKSVRSTFAMIAEDHIIP
jgi:hypothetical protein